MKLASFVHQDKYRWGIVETNSLVDVTMVDSSLPRSLKHAIATWQETGERLADCLGRAERIPLETVSLMPPIHSPEKILCIGRNYADHATEQGADIPTEPVVFNKLPSTLIGSGQPIQIPAIAQQVDFEGELVVIIGKEGFNIPQESAMEHVFGYTCGNDVTARDWQKGRPGGQWLLGKTCDSFGPLGPWLTTADEFGDPTQVDLETHLNGELMQRGNTRQFLFGIDMLISHLSQFFKLVPGDLLFTGTPEGVGIARNPPILLKAGDEVTVSITGIGVLRNAVLNRDA